MKTQILSALAVVALVTGCAELRKNKGASFETRQDVLIGGPVNGTTIKDLPDAVKQTLKQRVPNGEIADIEKQTGDGAVVYKVAFIEPGKNATLFIGEDGAVIQTR